MNCPKCRFENPPHTPICPQCGYRLTSDWRFNKGCLIPVVLIGTTLFVSIIMYLTIRYLDANYPPQTDLTNPYAGLSTWPTSQPTTTPSTRPAGR
jgi:hypothetical protein